MTRFLIGQYGSYDPIKQATDFAPGFYGVEACLLDSDKDIERLISDSREHRFRIGIHFPLRSGTSEMRDALILSKDTFIREQSFQLIEQECRDYAARVKPAYILYHYPKPVILAAGADWTKWKFSDSSEYIHEDDFSADELRRHSEIFFQRISGMGERHGFMPILELDAMNRYLVEGGLLEELLQRYPSIRLCLDTGRLYRQDRIDPRFNSLKVVKKYAKYAALIHLWTFRFTDKIECYRMPVLPEQDAAEGWAPILAYLSIIREQNPDVAIMFEHRSDLVSDSDLLRCYEWVRQVMAGEVEMPA